VTANGESAFVYMRLAGHLEPWELDVKEIAHEVNACNRIVFLSVS
jgi:hypothetical protein